MKRFFWNRGVIAISCFGLGALLTYLIMRAPGLQTHKNPSLLSQMLGPSFHQVLEDDFFNSDEDPFETMQNLQKKLRQLHERDSRALSPFEGWGGFAHSSNPLSLTTQEDETSISYQIKLNGALAESLQVEVNDGMIEISGRKEERKKGPHEQTLMSSSFQQSFPVPAGVQADQVHVDRQKDQLILKFPKTK